MRVLATLLGECRSAGVCQRESRRRDEGEGRLKLAEAAPRTCLLVG